MTGSALSLKELKVKEAELVKTEARIRSLIEQLADSGAADYVRRRSMNWPLRPSS